MASPAASAGRGERRDPHRLVWGGHRHPVRPSIAMPLPARRALVPGRESPWNHRAFPGALAPRRPADGQAARSGSVQGQVPRALYRLVAVVSAAVLLAACSSTAGSASGTASQSAVATVNRDTHRVSRKPELNRGNLGIRAADRGTNRDRPVPAPHSIGSVHSSAETRSVPASRRRTTTRSCAPMGRRRR